MQILKYKSSSVEEMGAIPEAWEVTKLKYCFVLNMGQSPDSKFVNNEGIGLPFLQGNAEFGEIHPVEKYYCTKPKKKSRRNDLLVSVRAPVGALNKSDKEYAIGRGLAALTPNPKKISQAYSIYAIEYSKFQLQRLSTGSTYDAVAYNDLSGIAIVLPSLSEQNNIAVFLDQKTSEIDEAIAKKKNLIKLLEEQKSILINQAVTKGLNPDAPMRDSGVEWIGKIPKHWNVSRAKYLFREIDCRSVDGTEELLSVSHTTGVTPRSEKNVNMFLAEDYSGSKLCGKDDLVYNIMWAWMGALGVSDRTGIVSPSYGVYRQREAGTFNSWYLEHLMRSVEYVAEYNRRSTGLHSSRLRLYADMFFAMEIGFPSREEQDEIERETKKKLSVVGDVLDATFKEISYLQEYKQTLVAHAVTGKIKV